MIVLTAGVKGGTGKTTLAANLAVERTRAGYDVLVVDADPDQGNLYDFVGLRQENNGQPELKTVKLDGMIGQNLQDLRKRYDDIIVDCGGFDSAELRSALPVADRWIIPIAPTQFQMWTVQKLIELQMAANSFRTAFREPIEGWFLSSRHGTHPMARDREELAEALAEVEGFRVMEEYIKERKAFVTAERIGAGVSELPRSVYGADQATAEVTRVYRAIFGSEGEGA